MGGPNFTAEKSTIQYLGKGLNRPECVVAEKDGSIWTSDARGGLCHILKNGSQEFIKQNQEGEEISGSLPNGFAILKDGNFAIANMGTQRLEYMSRTGDTSVLCDNINDQSLGLVNFVLLGPDDNLWFTVSSKKNEFMDGFRKDVSDGYIGVFDGKITKIVAENLSFPNEIRFDILNSYLYVAETTGKRIRRLKILDSFQLGEPEQFGPASLGEGFPDGITFDSNGNLWVAMVVAEKLMMISPDQRIHTVMNDGNSLKLNEIERDFADNSLSREKMASAKGSIAPMISSIAFGGNDLRTIFLGSLAGSQVAFFHSPISGQPMPHWT